MRSRPASLLSARWVMAWMGCFILLATDWWILGLSLLVLLVGIRVLRQLNGPAVVLAAFLFQWLQATIAPFYGVLTGRQIPQLRGINYKPMTVVGLVAITCYFGGYWLLTRKRKKETRTIEPADAPLFPQTLVTVAYFSAIAISVTLQRIAWSYPQLTQALFLLGFVRYVLLFVLITRLMQPTPHWRSIAIIVVIELAMGFTGFFATFRESLVFTALAIGAASRRKTPWLSYALIGTLALSSGLVWTAIKPVVRKGWIASQSTAQRLDNVLALAGPAMENMEWGVQTDRLVSRIWMMHYPSLAYERVPDLIPHEGGELLKGAVMNLVMPRVFFPDKGVLPSESEKVRKYAGIWVAGRESNTSFAFGYAAESYVDFGIPLMFVPILSFGLLLGLGDRLVRRVLRNRDLQNGIRVVVLWPSMYLFEQSWVIMLGMSFGLFVLLTTCGFVFERALHLADAVPGERTKSGLRLPRASSRTVPMSHPMRRGRAAN